MVKSRYQIPRLIACLLVPALAGLAAVWLHRAPPARAEAVARLRAELPAQLNGYSGQGVLHCQNTQCLKSFLDRGGESQSACPTCGGELLPLSYGERHLLPADTRITRRLYSAPGSPVYTVTTVLAGSDPRSIHRPQQCLPAQGYIIDRQRLERIPLRNGRNLQVVLIEAHRGADPRARFGFVYWFVGPRRETASHFVRLAWTLYDSLFRNTVSRWAYVAITANEPLDTPESLLRLGAFLGELVPAIELAPPPGAP